MITIETCDGYFLLIDDTHGKAGIAQTKSRTQACRIRDALNATNTILGRQAQRKDIGVGEPWGGTVVAIGPATCISCSEWQDGVYTPQTCLVLCLRLGTGDLVEVPAHECRIVDPPCEAGAPIEAPRGTHIDSVEARAILDAVDPYDKRLSESLLERLAEIAKEPTP